MPYQPLDLSFLMTPEMEAGIEEMKRVISACFPDATYEVDYGEEPAVGVYLFATFEHENLGDALDCFIDRLVDLQVDEGLRLYVTPLPPAPQSRDVRRRQKERATA